MKWINCDGGFKSIMDKLADSLDIPTNYANPDDHVTDIEGNNQVVEEIFRISYYSLPYKKIPRLMIWYHAMIETTKLNLFLANFGILFSDGDWPAVEGNLRKAQVTWGRLARILGREGADPKVSCNFILPWHSRSSSSGRRPGSSPRGWRLPWTHSSAGWLSGWRDACQAVGGTESGCTSP